MARSLVETIIAVRDLSRCLGDARHLHLPIPVPELLAIIKRMIEAETGKPFEIDVECRDWKGAEFRSVLLRYQSSAKIIYSKSLNTCWRRFSVCKELAHLAFDQPDTFTTSYADLVPLLVADAPVPENMVGPIYSENLHYFAALELLVPWELRHEIDELCVAGKTDYEIAVHCKVPEQVIATILRSAYRKLSERIHKEYDKKIGGDWSAAGISLS